MGAGRRSHRTDPATGRCRLRQGGTQGQLSDIVSDIRQMPVTVTEIAVPTTWIAPEDPDPARTRVGVVDERRRAVRLGLLDGFRLEVDGVAVDPLGSAQRLVAYLALHGPHMRTAVAGTLWANVAEERAMASLRTTVWRANRVVPELVRAARTQLALADSVEVDVDHLVARAQRLVTGRDCELDVSLVRRNPGELLPGWYEDWVIFERERLRHLRLHSLEAASAQLLQQQRFTEALDIALAAVRCEPLRESAHCAVIAVHLAEGNQVEAIRHYQRFRRLLVSELGVEPSARLVAVVFGERPRSLTRP